MVLRGATALEACIKDHRLKAGINIDGWPYGELFNSGEKIIQPVMLIRSETDDDQEEIINTLIAEQVSNSVITLKIEDAEHSNFWDFPLFFRIYRRFGYWGPIEPLRLHEIMSRYTLSFFDKYLKGKDPDLLRYPSEVFPEVTFELKQGK